ncbi:hypothetical protein Salmi_Mp080 (mitochondrion) [Salvia miltiorrhiza]|uniref:Uncharacterized protein n=1 Tax=Salvia miltiorrhiza TaxID=226208 RepID=V9P5B9_SALMI|nr:hypothetical protein Salmi_Mp080 [Salvia miltiorrhiza]AGU16608.1 hypothetical protein Salmi_Mp080 [Salvia miltiorrhiza]
MLFRDGEDTSMYDFISMNDYTYISNDILSGKSNFHYLLVDDKYLYTLSIKREDINYIRPVDEVVLRALSRALYDIFNTYVSFPLIRSEEFHNNFISTVVSWDKVDRLLIFDLSLSKSTMPHPLLMKKLKSFISDDVVLCLIANFLAMPIKSTDGILLSKDGIGIPPVDTLGSMLLSLYMDEVDQCFKTLFSNFKYVRYMDLVIIPMYLWETENQILIFYRALLEFGIISDIYCIPPGGSSLLKLNVDDIYVLNLNRDGSINVYCNRIYDKTYYNKEEESELRISFINNTLKKLNVNSK